MSTLHETDEGSGVRVLVVDDEPDVRLIARVVLEAAGFTVEEAADGATAITAVEADDKPDVLLLDIRMPDVDGWRVLQTLREAPGGDEVPVVVFSADAGVTVDMPEGIEPHAVLAKPFQPDRLLELVQSAVGETPA
jgi:CheY-like chemotaxis protein